MGSLPLARHHAFRYSSTIPGWPQGHTPHLNKVNAVFRHALLALLLLSLALIASCAPSLGDGRGSAQGLAAHGGMRKERFETQTFTLQGWERPSAGKVLQVYIEGDGQAWLTPSRPSDDPTPANPVALRMALADPAIGPVLYLGRPCQYVEGADRKGCSTDDWTTARFSSRAVAAVNQAIDQAKQRLGAVQTALYGYSGGGAMAVLVAAKRHDVVFLGTVAANLDHQTWTRIQKLTPLSGSLNAADVADSVRAIPQVHVLGGEDTAVPAGVQDAFLTKLGPGAPAKRRVVPECGHACNWQDYWRSILLASRPITAEQ